MVWKTEYLIFKIALQKQTTSLVTTSRHVILQSVFWNVDTIPTVLVISET